MTQVAHEACGLKRTSVTSNITCTVRRKTIFPREPKATSFVICIEFSPSSPLFGAVLLFDLLAFAGEGPVALDGLLGLASGFGDAGGFEVFEEVDA